jgi:O-antigen ligase
MPWASTSYLLDSDRLTRVAGCLAIAVAVSLPWSTSATGILVVLWLLALVPTLFWADVRAELTTAAGGLPVLLVLLGAVGTLWADVPWPERWSGVESFVKLLVIPLLLVQFRRSDRGLWVFGGYVLSCVALLAISTLVQFVPGFSFIPMHYDHVIVKNAPTQSGELVTCILGLLFLVLEALERRRWLWGAGLLAVVLGMLANIFYVATGRTALAVILVLLVIFAFKKLNGRGVVVFFAAVTLVGGIGLFSSPFLRDRIAQIWTDAQKYQATNATNSSGERIEFWKKSVAFIVEAPIIGHGTGSMHSLFQRAVVGKTGAAASATTNPHNQTFAVAIQLGLIGAAVLWAMWIAHLLLFRGNSLADWVGLIVVVQNVVGSLFNSHLFDFGQGWIYVLGVGVVGGMVTKRRPPPASTTALSS